MVVIVLESVAALKPHGARNDAAVFTEESVLQEEKSASLERDVIIS